MEKYKCCLCGDIVEQSEAGMWWHIRFGHPKQFEKLRDLSTPDMVKECYLPEDALFGRKIPLATPAYVYEMIADLTRSGTVTQDGDRKSRYFPVAMGCKEKCNQWVMVALVEEMSGIPRKEAGYAFHVINDVDDSNCQMFQTDHLDAEEALALFDDILKKLENGRL